MPLTPEQKREYLTGKGLNPDEYDVEEIGAPNPSPENTQPQISKWDTFKQSGIRSLLPTGGMLGGMRAGAMLPIPHPLGKAVAIVGGGILGSLATNWGQEKALEKIQGPEAYAKNLEQYEAGRSQNPGSAAMGELAPTVPFLGSGGAISELGKIFSPATISKAKLLQAAAGMGLQGGIEGGRELVQGEDISPARIAAYGVGGGLLQSTPTKLGAKVLGPSFRPPEVPPIEVLQGAQVKPKVVTTPVTETKDIIPFPSEELKKENIPLNKQQDIEGLQGSEIKPSLQTDQSPEVKGELDKVPQEEEGYIDDPGKRLYQEGPNKFTPEEDKYWLSPKSELIPADGDHGVKSIELLQKIGKYSDATPFEPKDKLMSYGYVRVHKGNNVIFIEGNPINSQLRELKNLAIEERKMLVRDYVDGKERVIFDPGEGQNNYYSEAPEKEVNSLGGNINEPKSQELAIKRGVTIQKQPEIISDQTQRPARGVAIPEERRAIISDIATPDTGYHEVTHTTLKDWETSDNPRDREFRAKGLRAAGSEEALTEAIGKRVDEINNKPLRTWLEDAKDYVLKTEGSEVKQAARRIRDDRPFSESPELHGPLLKEINKFYSEANPQGTLKQKTLSFSSPLKSVVDKIEEKSPVAAKAIESAERESSRLNGKITNAFVENASKIKDKENASKYIWESRYNEGKPTVLLNPKDRALIDGPINESYKQVHEEQRNNGPLINGREAIDNPNLKGPNIISQSVLDTILHKPSTDVRRQALIKDFIEHQIKYGESKNATEAKENFNSLLSGFSASVQGNTAAFNALRKAEGFGIPWSWMEQDPVKLFQKYGNRVARDLAYYRNIESNPEVAALFGHSKMKGVEPITGPEIKTAQKRLTGQHTTSETTYSAVEHFVRSLILGPVTGVKNTVSTLAQILPYVPIRDLPKIAEAFGKIKQGFVDSMKMGVNRHSITALETGDLSGVSRVAENLKNLGDIIRKYTGANAIEQWTRAHNMALGEILTESYWGKAAKGDIEARKFLRMFAPEGEKLDFKNLVNLPESVKLETAARFVERIQGTYGLRGLPSFLLEPTSPAYWFMSLSKWSVEKANVITKDVINPALSGDYGPLLRYSLGGLVAGEAVRAIGEELNNKKANTPNLKEVQEKGKTSDVAYKLFELSNLAGLGGIYSDLLKMTGDLGKGYNTRGYNIPSVELAKDITTEIGNASQAIQEGQDGLGVVVSLVENILTDNIQALRMVHNQVNPEEGERADKFRDKRIYDKLDGKNIPAPQGRTDRYGNKDAREFKRAKTVEEGKEILNSSIKPRLATLPKEEKKKEIASLKQNNYQTVPSDPKEAAEYYSYIRKTQGIDAMVKLKKDKAEQNRVNKVKSRLVR